MNKTQIVIAFLLGILFNQSSNTSKAHADSSMADPLNRIAAALADIASSQRSIASKMK